MSLFAARMLTPQAASLRPLARGLLVLAILLGAGCSSTRHETPEQTEKRIAAERARSAEAVRGSMVGKQHQLSIPELDQLTYGYADRYYAVISDAVDSIKRGNPDP